MSWTKEKQAEYRRKHYLLNKEETLKKNKEWKVTNREKYLAQCQDYYQRTREKQLAQIKEYRLKNPELVFAQRKAARTKGLERRRAYIKNRMSTDPLFRLTNSLRVRIRLALCGKIKAGFTMVMLGCSGEELKKHLEKQFTSEMNWSNYGTFWHIDHIRPCASFDLSLPEQQKICFHYSNLQPLKAIDNLRKHCKIKPPLTLLQGAAN